MIRSVFTLITILLVNISFFAQVTNTGKPLSWELKMVTKKIKKHILPTINLKKLQQEDITNDKLAIPWRFGFKQVVNLGFKDGQWTTLENGDRIWRINIVSKGALSMNVIFDSFFMPNGGKVYLYNEDRSDLLGAYTAIQNQKSGRLGTWLVKGSNLWIEYYEPANVINQGRLHIGSVTHGYRNANTYKNQKSLGDSGNCNHDVDCPIGADWENHKNNNKKSVALLISGGSSFCSGALINNTENDKKGYFLTANHCYSNPANWTFLFDWISPNPVCAGTENSTNGPVNMTISGATLRAKNAHSDFALVEINSEIPNAWNRTWAGWDNSDTNPTFEVGIHHPSGDIMKICRDNTGAVTGAHDAGSGIAQTWDITAAGGGWEIGVTEGGSSGSPLFDQNGRIIGQLYGGGAACSGLDDNNRLDYYGRFGVSWSTIAGDSNQLKPWLNPNNQNITTLDSYPPLQIYSLDASVSTTIPDIACGENQIEPIISIRNNGTSTLTSATINWNINGGTNTTVNWTGTLAQNETENITLESMVIHQEITINTTISNPNNGNDQNTSNDSSSTNFSIQNYETVQIHLDLLTDDYSEETSWEFKDENGNVLYRGGPYIENQEDNMHFLESFNVNPNTCYSFTIKDNATNPDGICCNFGNGSYTLKDDRGNVIFSGGNFTTSETTEIAISSVNTIDFLTEKVLIYPNPSSDILYIDLFLVKGNFTYYITNTLGQTVIQGNLHNIKNTLNLSSLDNGLYFLKIEDRISKKDLVKKIIISN